MSMMIIGKIRLRNLVFRLISGLLCVLMLTFGCYVLYRYIFIGHFQYDGTFKAGIAAFFWGIVMLVATLKGER